MQTSRNGRKEQGLPAVSYEPLQVPAIKTILMFPSLAEMRPLKKYCFLFPMENALQMALKSLKKAYKAYSRQVS